MQIRSVKSPIKSWIGVIKVCETANKFELQIKLAKQQLKPIKLQISQQETSEKYKTVDSNQKT
ncbi:hypothetical protein COJ46_15385 [Bacillus sp. AFS077874]|nr:hypothetical protein CON00_07335 [Bacillus sp. AFS096315]PFM79649.1 hypothetical protein COJ46_15385 [Bacillus sp. AFS077874]